MDRRAFIAGAAGGLVFTPLVVKAQTSGTVYRVGILLNVQERFPTESAVDKAFVEGLREHGYIVGENIVIEARSAAGRLERLPELAAELVRLKCDVILVPTTQPALVARQATTTIPIVTMAAADPVRAGLAASLAKPGGNVTGISVVPGEDYIGKHIQLLAEAVPTKRIAVLRHAPNPARPYSQRKHNARPRRCAGRLASSKSKSRTNWKVPSSPRASGVRMPST